MSFGKKSSAATQTATAQPVTTVQPTTTEQIGRTTVESERAMAERAASNTSPQLLGDTTDEETRKRQGAGLLG
jgi:hypothetical protein